ncbi:MAG: hypothetical protein U1E59_01340 [Amaricoccus sp.]
MIRKSLPLLIALLPVPAAAGPLSDLLMAPGLFDAAPAGEILAYNEERSVPAGDAPTVKPVRGGEVRLDAVDGAGGRELRLFEGSGDAARPVGSFPTGVANPLLLYFLETTVRVMAEASGGSPYYIRNRIRDALAVSDLGAADGAAREATLTPFANDPNRPRMGEFGDLAIRLRFDPAAPARILELSADTATAGSGYHEKLVLIGEE